MGIREKLNQSPAVVVALMAGAILVAVLVSYWQLSGASVRAQTSAFYTDDDGATFFTDDINRVVPFDRSGRMAYRAEVFRCGDEPPFVAFIGRHTPEGRREMEQFLARGAKDADGSIREGIEYRGMEIKPVGAGDRGWIRNDSGATERLLASVRCPSGEPATPVQP